MKQFGWNREQTQPEPETACFEAFAHKPRARRFNEAFGA